MKKIDTSAITSGSWMPVLGNYGGNNFVNGSPSGSLAGLDFLQQAYYECLNALSQFIVNDQTQPTVMYIAPPPPPSPGPYQVANFGTQGFMNYQGEIYAFSFPNEVALRIGGGPQYQNANIVTTFSGADPVTFSDSSIHNVHQIRQVQFSWSSTRNAGNIPDYDLWLNATNNSYASVLAQTTLNNWVTANYTPFLSAYNANVTPTVIQVGAMGAPAFQNSWGNSTGIPQHTGNYPSPLSYCIMFNRVYIWGEITNNSVTGNSTIFTLPSGYTPLAYEEVFQVWNTGLQHAVGGSDVTPPYYLVITSGGAVQLLSQTTTPFNAIRNITLSGISFVQGVHSSTLVSDFYSTALTDVATHTDTYTTSLTDYYYSGEEMEDTESDEHPLG